MAAQAFDCPPRQMLLAAGLGAGFFLWLFGVQPLDPANIGWLMHGDPAQHYLGWQFFRSEPWHWPPGRIDNYGAPLGTAILFTDSIPLLAFLLKPLSPWLPADFQYFGLWMFVCYLLAAVFGWRLMVRATPHWGLRALGALFFLMSPAMLLRAYGHEALMAHWLLLAGIDRYASPWRGAAWLVLLVVASLVHPYLLLMMMALAAAALYRAIFSEKGLARPWQPMLLGMTVLLAVMWAAGYFIPAPRQLAAEGYGHYSANLLTFVDPMDWHDFLRSHGRDTAGKQEWSQFLKPRAQATNGQYEGFAYLGLGVLVLAAAVFSGLLARPPRWQTARFWLPLLAASTLLFVAALSYRITVGANVLATIPWPAGILDVFAVFRASGRFVWLLYYLLLWGVLAAVVRRWSPRAAMILLVVGLGLQYADLRGKFGEFRHQFRNLPVWQTSLKDPVWEETAARYRHIIVYPPQTDGDAYIPLAHLAARNAASINIGYFARADSAAQRAYAQRLADEVSNGRLRPDTLYLFPRPADLEAIRDRLAAGDEVLEADGYGLLLPGGRGER